MRFENLFICNRFKSILNQTLRYIKEIFIKKVSVNYSKFIYDMFMIKFNNLKKYQTISLNFISNLSIQLFGKFQ